MIDDFQSGSIQTAQADREQASESWLAERRRLDENTVLAIKIICAGRQRDPVTTHWTDLDDESKRRAIEQDQRIAAELARHGLSWNDCDFH